MTQIAQPYPTSAAGLTPVFLTELMGRAHPCAEIEAAEVVEAKAYGEQMGSTSARAVLDLRYARRPSPEMPDRVVVKFAPGIDKIMAPFYRNEASFYATIRPELTIEAPTAGVQATTRRRPTSRYRLADHADRELRLGDHRHEPFAADHRL